MDNTREVAPPQVKVTPQQVSVVLDWSNADTVQPQHINQVMGQIGNPTPDGIPDGVYVGLGSVPPPIILGRDEQAQRQAMESLQLSPVKITVHGRFHMSRGMLDAIIHVLQTTAAQYDAAVEARQPEGQG